MSTSAVDHSSSDSPPDHVLAPPTDTPDLPVSSSPSVPLSHVDYSVDLYHSAGVRHVLLQCSLAQDFQHRLTKFLKEKAELDRSYAKSLRKALEKAGLPEKASRDSSWDLFLVSLNSFHSALASNLEILAAKEEEFICKQISQVSLTHQKRARLVSEEIQKLQKQAINSEESAIKAKIAAKNSANAAETALKELELTDAAEAARVRDQLHSAASDSAVHASPASMFEDVFASFKADFKSVDRRSQAADRTFHQAVKAAQSFRPVFEDRVRSSLIELQTAEIDRLQRDRELISQYLALQSTMFRSSIKNLATVSGVLDSVKVTEDLANFVKRINETADKEGERAPLQGPPIKYEDFRVEIGLGRARQNSKSAETHQSAHSAEEAKSHDRLLAEHVLHDILQQILRSGQLAELDHARAKEFFTSPQGRRGFASVLNQQRNTNGGLALSDASFDALSQLVWTFLDYAFEDSLDAPSAQLVMIMSQSFYRSKSDQRDRIFLSSKLLGHRIWASIRFWEESFFDALTSRLASQPSVHSDRQNEIYNRRQLTFALLSTFAHNMREFGMAPNHIRTFVEKQAIINDLDSEQCEMLRSLVSQDQHGTATGEMSEEQSPVAAKRQPHDLR